VGWGIAQNTKALSQDARRSKGKGKKRTREAKKTESKTERSVKE